MKDVATKHETVGDQRLPNGTFAPGNRLGFPPGVSGHPGQKPNHMSFGRRSRDLDDRLASEFGWSRDAAEKFGLDPEIKIGDLMIHATKAQALDKASAYLIEDNNRREGRQGGGNEDGEVQVEVRIRWEVDPGPMPIDRE